MTNEQSVLIQLIRAALTQTPVELSATEDIDWKAVAMESQMHAVLPLAYEAASTVSALVPEELYTKWTTRTFAIMAANAKIDYCQQELVALLEQNRCPYIILKGAAAAAYYPKAELRTQGDVDFLIEPSQKDAVTALLRENGYLPEGEELIHHVAFKKGGVTLEMHFREPAIPQGIIGEKIRSFFTDNVRRTQTLDSGTHRFCAPTDSRHGLILLLHMQHHMLGEGIGLRHLCDWGCFVQHTVDAPFWGDLLRFLKEIGLFTYAACVTRLCAEYFGTPLPDWATAVDSAVCRALLDDILTSGNFGKKDVKRARSGMMITYSTSDSTDRSRLYYLYHTLINVIDTTHPCVKRFPVLYPVFAVKTIILYAFRVLSGKRLSIGTLAATAEERRSVYQKLHIFEVEKL